MIFISFVSFTISFVSFLYLLLSFKYLLLSFEYFCCFFSVWGVRFSFSVTCFSLITCNKWKMRSSQRYAITPRFVFGFFFYLNVFVLIAIIRNKWKMRSSQNYEYDFLCLWEWTYYYHVKSSSLHEVLLYKEDNEFCTSILAERATKNHQGCNRRASSIVVVLPPAHGGMFATSVKPSDGFKIRATPERL